MSLKIDRTKRPLRLDKRNGYIAGVCAGAAHYLGIDPVIVRVGAIVAGIFSAKIVIAAYLIAWLLLDDRDERRD